ncbi:hypothetical protein B5P46_31950 [Rhizobium leguminosarum]|uniref:Uncharacterized protein n=1 Tax=Rhizobium leguminosarum TaxID=384 RepID=A0A4Q1TEA5_RHILE|nr:hypothetical protein B5P46_31950 [Rhizobium leguminosarum]
MEKGRRYAVCSGTPKGINAKSPTQVQDGTSSGAVKSGENIGVIQSAWLVEGWKGRAEVPLLAFHPATALDVR